MTRSAPVAVVFASALLACIESAPVAAAPVVVSDLIEAKATVESVDMASRKVLLRDESGALDTIIAGPEVRNLAQVRAGDHVLVRVHEAIAVEMAKPGSQPVNAVGSLSGRAKPGEKPAALQAEELQARVKITAVDVQAHTVSFVGPARILRVVHVTNPKMQTFVSTLKVGDEVDVAYTIAVAVAVVPAGS